MRTKAGSVLLAVLLALGAAACEPSTAKPDDTGSPPATETGAKGPINTTLDTYRYQNAGMNVLLKFEGNGGTMEVANNSGHDLPRPDFYVLDARDGHEIEGKVADSKPVPDGKTESFRISLAAPIELKNIGLVILLMGDDNYGAFVRQ